MLPASAARALRALDWRQSRPREATAPRPPPRAPLPGQAEERQGLVIVVVGARDERACARRGGRRGVVGVRMGGRTRARGTIGAGRLTSAAARWARGSGHHAMVQN